MLTPVRVRVLEQEGVQTKQSLRSFFVKEMQEQAVLIPSVDLGYEELLKQRWM